MRPSTIDRRRHLYLLARVVIARHYRRPLTLDKVARALASSPRQLTRAYAQFGEVSFREDLLTRRLNVAAQLLIEQPAIPVREVARLVGFRQAPHFAKAFRRRYGLSPASFRAEGRAYARSARSRERDASPGAQASRATRHPSVAPCVCGASASGPREAPCRGPRATRPVLRPEGAGASGRLLPPPVGR
jgi:AraC family transcriptional regulator of adaptative response / methylphosphotriester-DNA alkyltransferase methyltransferase